MSPQFVGEVLLFVQIFSSDCRVRPEFNLDQFYKVHWLRVRRNFGNHFASNLDMNELVQ